MLVRACILHITLLFKESESQFFKLRKNRDNYMKKPFELNCSHSAFVRFSAMASVYSSVGVQISYIKKANRLYTKSKRTLLNLV